MVPGVLCSFFKGSKMCGLLENASILLNVAVYVNENHIYIYRVNENHWSMPILMFIWTRFCVKFSLQIVRIKAYRFEFSRWMNNDIELWFIICTRCRRTSWHLPSLVVETRIIVFPRRVTFVAKGIDCQFDLYVGRLKVHFKMHVLDRNDNTCFFNVYFIHPWTCFSLRILGKILCAPNSYTLLILDNIW